MTDRPEIEVEAADYDSMWSLARARGEELASVVQTEELFRYDATIVDIVQTPSESIWLRAVVESSGRTTDDEWSSIKDVVHLLRFDGPDAAKATLHDGFVPTIDSYARCSEIVEQTIGYEARIGAEPRDFRYRSKRMSRDDIPTARMPYPQLRPGAVMEFELDDRDELSASNRLYHYPTPEDVVFASYDGACSWLGRVDDCGDPHARTWLGRTRDPFAHPVRIVVRVEDHGSSIVQHRLSFRADNEQLAIASLAAGIAPTGETYRLAKTLHVETITWRSDAPTLLRVEQVDPIDGIYSKPTFDTVADHDRAWPRFASLPPDTSPACSKDG